MPQAYAELHCLSNFTFLRGASHSEELVERAVQLGYQALAITDECSLAGVVRAYAAARNTKLKLIIGAEFRLTPHPDPLPGAEREKTLRPPGIGRDNLRLVLLAQNREGYGNLSEFITRGRRNAKKGEYHLSRADLEPGIESCLALWLPSAQPLAEDAHWLAARFPGRTWIAVELLAHGGDWDRLETLQCLGRQTGLPLTACGDVHMHARSRRALQDTLTAIRLGVPVSAAGLALQASGERHMRPRETLERIYPRSLLDETIRISGLCNFSLEELRYEYPEEIVPENKTPTQYLRELTEAGLEERYPGGVPETVRNDAGKELALIAELRYEAFFLTVYDVVKYARRQQILCQGRGSAANSVVCYALGITEVDPNRTRLLFGRFLSKERNEPPDIDVDFEHERREEVIQYIYRKYGRDRAALAATVITYQARSAFRDIGKALGLDAVQLDRISGSLVWWDRPEERAARLREAGFDPHSSVIRKLIALTNTLIGFPRHLSQHVGGFVISRGPLSQLVPTENAAMPGDPSRYTDDGIKPASKDAAAASSGPLRTNIQWDKDDLEELGLLKVDVLALGMLTAIRRALDLVNRRRGRALSMADILLTEDSDEGKPVYDMLCEADSIGVFQVESRAQMSMLPRLRPRNYYDLVVEVAIVRPGPIQGGMVHPYLNNRKKKPEEIEYPSLKLKKVLERTLGVPIFQEQVMEIAMVAAGFSAGKADQLRRAMAAWKRKGGLGPFKDDLINGMIKNHYDAKFALQIFEQIKGFGEYGFPESHSASFALLVYVSAWLKHYEPAAFTCALLNSQPMGFYSPSQLVQDAQRHGVEVRPVDALVSSWDCTLEPRSGSGTRHEARGARNAKEEHNNCEEPRTNTSHLASESLALVPSASRRAPDSLSLTPDGQPAIRLGLRMISGFSQNAAERLIGARVELCTSLSLRPSSLVPRPSVEDLAQRAKLSRRGLRLLAEAGALGSLAGHRRNAAWLVAGIEKLPPLLAHATIAESAADLPAPTEGQDILADYASTGLTLRRHPLALLRPRLEKDSFSSAKQLKNIPTNTPVRVAGLVTCRQHPDTAKGVIFVTLEDETGQINVVVWKKLSRKQRRPLLAARLLRVDGTLEREGDVTHLIAEHLTDYSTLIGNLDVHSRDFH
ncbi:MAG TPA: error-prone DNA polymerase [Burkholderiales bacterium]|nr:error-prone DNA polymerase [Burkholderiales bacterium]